jgi:hypothetical protein
MLADKVVFLARVGYMAWFGPPNEALDYFDQYRTERERLSQDMEFDQIYAILDDPSKGSAQEWAQRFQQHAAYQTYITSPLQTRQKSMPLAAAAKAGEKPKARRRTRVSSLRQFSILSSRNLKILTRDRSSLVLMLMAAPLVAMLDFVIAPLMGKATFDFMVGSPSDAPVTLFLMTIYALLVGGLSQMREIVKEGDIYKRERLVNLQIFPYITSKIWVAALLALYQAACYTVIHYLAFDMPGGAAEFFAVYITMVWLHGGHGGRLVGFCPGAQRQLRSADHDPADRAPDRLERRPGTRPQLNQLSRLHSLGVPEPARHLRHGLRCGGRSMLDAV